MVVRDQVVIGTDHLEVELRADAHGIDQFLADIGDPIAAWSGRCCINRCSSSGRLAA